MPSKSCANCMYHYILLRKTNKTVTSSCRLTVWSFSSQGLSVRCCLVAPCMVHGMASPRALSIHKQCLTKPFCLVTVRPRCLICIKPAMLCISRAPPGQGRGYDIGPHGRAAADHHRQPLQELLPSSMIPPQLPRIPANAPNPQTHHLSQQSPPRNLKLTYIFWSRDRNADVVSPSGSPATSTQPSCSHHCWLHI